MASYPQTSLVPHVTILNKLGAFLLQGFSYFNATTRLFMCKHITKTGPPDIILQEHPELCDTQDVCDWFKAAQSAGWNVSRQRFRKPRKHPYVLVVCTIQTFVQNISYYIHITCLLPDFRLRGWVGPWGSYRRESHHCTTSLRFWQVIRVKLLKSWWLGKQRWKCGST